MIPVTRTSEGRSATPRANTSVPAEVLERRRALLRETAGCWSREEADHIVSELRRLFDQPDDDNGSRTR